MVAVLCVALVGLGCASLGGSGRDPAADHPPPGAPMTPQTLAATTEAAPADTPTLAPTPVTPPTPTRKPKVAPSRKPTRVALPPPPPKTTPPGCKPTYTGPVAPRATVRAALDTAAARTYWGSKPEIKVPVKLLYAVAWQESGWQSTIVACDGGIGTMQVMPATATWMNQRFGTGYDVHTLAGNTSLGAQYLAWLIRYFGDVFFGETYDLTNQALLDSVIAAYNVGPAAVDPTLGRPGIPNWNYVDNVEALMTSCPCTG
jgi:soluble lytic murein transglycosylase-like protein